MNRFLAKEYIFHHLRMCGGGNLLDSSGLHFCWGGESQALSPQSASADLWASVIFHPSDADLGRIGAVCQMQGKGDYSYDLEGHSDLGRLPLRTLHPYNTYWHSDGIPVVVDSQGRAVWLWVPAQNGGFLLIGSDFSNDVLRFRQGDPQKAVHPPTEQHWGIPGERPTYLYESQLNLSAPSIRYADFWVLTLATFLARTLGKPLSSVLPNNAVGAIVITGDDDQAFLEKYDEQLELLGDTPITYLLHPLTRHTQHSLRAMQKRNPFVDFGIHPDALEAPERYGELFDQQITWYRKLTGGTPASLRNHGFLNDGYWGHLDTWLKHGVCISSNLPGFDGRVLNGSLLPARMVWRGTLTPHWSVLTVIGDGVRFAGGMSDEDAAECVRNVADGIRQSGIPGVMVLNLHPQNVAETRAMHHAALEVIRSGFVAWNLRQCLDWFYSREGGPLIPSEDKPWLTRHWTSLCERLRGELR